MSATSRCRLRGVQCHAEYAEGAEGVSSSRRAKDRAAGKPHGRRCLHEAARSASRSPVLRALLAAGVAAGAACGAQPAGDVVVIDFWAMGREGEVVQELTRAFERLNPGIRVRVQQIPWTAAHEKLLTAYVGDATPDVAQLGNTWVPEMAALGALEDLGPWVERSAVVDPAAFFPGIWDTNVVGGRVYGVPWYVDTRLLFYRRDLLERAGYAGPPATWDEWRDAMRRIKALLGGDAYVVLLETNDWRSPVILGMQAGSELLRDGGRYGDFSGARFRTAFEFYVGLFREGLAPTVSDKQVTNVYQDFARGYISMFLTGPWNLGEFRRRLPDSLQDAWATAPLPGPAGPETGVSVAGGASLVVYAASEHKAEAWRLIEFLAASEQQVRFYELMGNLPARQSAWEDAALAGDAHARAFREQLLRVRSTPKVPEWEQIAARVMQHAEAAALGELSVDEALASLDREVDRILEKRRWLLARRERERAGR